MTTRADEASGHDTDETSPELPGLTDEAKRLLEVAPRGAGSG